MQGSEEEASERNMTPIWWRRTEQYRGRATSSNARTAAALSRDAVVSRRCLRAARYHLVSEREHVHYKEGGGDCPRPLRVVRGPRVTARIVRERNLASAPTLGARATVTGVCSKRRSQRREGRILPLATAYRRGDSYHSSESIPPSLRSRPPYRGTLRHKHGATRPRHALAPPPRRHALECEDHARSPDIRTHQELPRGAPMSCPGLPSPLAKASHRRGGRRVRRRRLNPTNSPKMKKRGRREVSIHPSLPRVGRLAPTRLRHSSGT
ncbi:hypothetical protein MRX96_023190 [Rhipicephalus microplus]